MLLSAPVPQDADYITSTQPQGWLARIDLDFEKRGERSVLARNAHQGPLRVQKPLYPEGDGICHAIIVHPPGGIAGGDDLGINVDVAAQAHALITTPGATKWYRSSGPQSQQRVSLKVAAAGVLEWLPQENIIFNAAHVGIHTHINLQVGARAIGWDISCLGRTASQEHFERGYFTQNTDLHVGENLVWTERMALTGDDALLHSVIGLSGHTVFGTLWLAGLPPDRFLLDALRAQPFTAGLAGVTALPHVMLIRAVADSSEALKNYFMSLWHIVRPHCLQVDAQRPRIWAT